MSPDEAAREIADLRKRVQRLEDALEGLFIHRPRLVDGLCRPGPPVARPEPEEQRWGGTWPPGATFGGWR